MKNDKFIMTAEGFLEAETELNELKNVRRLEIIEAIKEARAQGDLSENADYDAARNEQAIVEAKIQELEYKLEHAEIIDNSDKNIVNLGSTVTISYDDGETEEYKLVGSMEADPFENKISNESPLGIALLKHKIGDVVEVASPNGGYNIKIEKIA
ncbi:MAG TPA: transcription elongation factor GreA [Candidatus Onthocola stercoravium]|nr:transcription elongation factor GreA [Candidatus Onthocola stercoravium]